MAWSFDFIAIGIYSILIGHCTAQRNEVFHYGFLQCMWPNPQETADFVTFTEEILNGKLHFLCSADGFRHSMRVYFELGLFFKIKIL